MNQVLQGRREMIERGVAQALDRQALSNRGSLAPFRLPVLARRIVAALMETAADTPATAGLGQELERQGLALPSLLEAQAAALTVAATVEEPAERGALIGDICRFFGTITQGFVASEAAESRRQRDEIERALMSAVSHHRQQEEQFQHTLSELSTPIIPVYEGILVLPLIGSINRRRASEITERLLEAIAANQAEIVIIDITGVPVIDSSTANHLLTTTRAANLLGSQVVLVGIGAEIAQTIVHLGVDLQTLVPLANLQSGIAYALRRLGMAIQPLGDR